jgi:formate dehydrogenase iron-sulfur subunit
MKKNTIYVPYETTAISLGANETYAVIQGMLPETRVKRNGSRGLYALEPLVEIENEQGRYAFTHVDADKAKKIFAQGVPSKDHPEAHNIEDLLKGQTRITFAGAGVSAACDLDAYEKRGGLKALKQALQVNHPQEIVDTIKTSGLRGRGGAAFSTGIKWQTVLDTVSDDKYIVCNADEGDSGTFADRLLMEADPFSLIEGMVIAGLTVGAKHGFIYLRYEYPIAYEVLQQAIDIARTRGVLGSTVLQSVHTFDIELILGAGAYVCGEETALIESMEGKRGMSRYKPPLPAIQGFMQKPTVVNNVLTLATVPAIIRMGATTHADIGYKKSKGTLTVQLSGQVKKPGLYELPFGTTVDEVIQVFGGGSKGQIKAVQIGGPLGAYLPADALDIVLDYESFSAIGALIGHGGIVVFDTNTSMLDMATFAMQFCSHESCGKCTPCRIGSAKAADLLKDIKSKGNADQLPQVLELCGLMKETSLCALGGMAPFPVESAIRFFPNEFFVR